MQLRIQEHFYKFCTQLSIRYINTYLDFLGHWTTAHAQVLLKKSGIEHFSCLLLNIFEIFLQGLNSKLSFSLSPSWVKCNIYAHTQRHRHVKNIQWVRITELTPDQLPVTWTREHQKWFKFNCSLFAGRMLLDLPEVQSNICSNSIL